MEIKDKKDELIKALEKVNSNITKEDIEKMSKEELLEFTKLNLEIQKNLTILQAAEDAGMI